MKSRPRKPLAPPLDQAASTADSASVLSWPASFASPRVSAYLAVASLLLAVAVFGTASLGGYTPLKVTMAGMLGIEMPHQVSASNYDLAFVLWSLATVTLWGVIHPCLGLALLVALRAWLDGYTFPMDNVYFTWGIYLLTAIWLVRLLRNRQRMVLPVPVWLMGALLLVMLAVTGHAHQYYAAYIQLWLWVGYAFLLLLAINIGRDRHAAAVLLGVFLTALGVQAAYSILHFEYLLPFMRTYVQDPAVLRRFFNTDVVTPELARRFNINRAFGSLLFPNALAGYLLLGIPWVYALLPRAWRSLKDAGRAGKKHAGTACIARDVRERVAVLALSVASGMAAFIAVHFVAHFPQEYAYAGMPKPWHMDPIVVGFAALLTACGVGTGSFVIGMRWGLLHWGRIMRFAGLCVLAPILPYTLFITYSRGAMLALVAAVVWGGSITFVAPKWFKTLPAAGHRLRTVLLCLVTAGMCLGAVALSLFGQQGWAQSGTAGIEAVPNIPPLDARPPDNRAAIIEEGIRLDAGDLVDPASFRLRLGYWRTAWRMAVSNPLTGVGLGNFARAYPIYQRLGDGDVKEAHNGFLQMFCETGVVGGTVFVLFWAYFTLWGARRIMRERHFHDKLLLLGLYVGVLAFCLHAALDIHFSHASLTFFAILCAGLFYARALPEPVSSAAGSSAGHFRRVLPFALLLTLALAAGALARPWLLQLSLARLGFINIAGEADAQLRRRMQAGRFFLSHLAQYAMAPNREELQPPRIPVSLALSLAPDLDAWASFCAFYRRDPANPRRFLRMENPDEPIPSDGLAVVRRPWLMHRAALEASLRWIDQLERMDGRFPHSPELALHIAQWYELHVHHSWGEEVDAYRPEWMQQYLAWADTAVKRNPYHADLRLFYAQALMWPALHVQGVDADTLIRLSTEQWERMLELSAISPGHRYAYAGAMQMIAEHLRRQGRDKEADQYVQRGARVHREGKELEDRRIALQIYG